MNTNGQELVQAGPANSRLTVACALGEANEPTEQSWEWLKLRKLACHQIDKFASLVPDVLRDDDTAAIHKMRVTSRRAEQMLDLFYPKPRPKYVRYMRRNVRRCRHLLGDIRNCDVLQQMAKQAVFQKAVANVNAWAAVSGYLHERRIQKAPAVLEKISRIKFAPAYVRIKRDLNSDAICFGLDHQHDVGRAAEHLNSKLAQERLLAALERRWQKFEAAVEDSRGDHGEEAVHRVRIAAKKVRYLVEVMKELEIPGSLKALDWLKALQRAIGEWHDLEVFDHLMAKALARSEFHSHASEFAKQIKKVTSEIPKFKRSSKSKFSQLARNSGEYRETHAWISGLLSQYRTGVPVVPLQISQPS